MEKFGFVGLPNAGKSSLYNALTGGGALAAPYAFATTDPNVGVAKVFDHRLDALAEMSGSKSVVPASVQFNDIGGLVEGASRGEGLGNKFLAGIREVDAIVFVLRAFRDDDVPGAQDPLEHLRIVELELTFADLGDGRQTARQEAKGGQGRPGAGRGGGGGRGGPGHPLRGHAPLPWEAERRARRAPQAVVPPDQQARPGDRQRRRGAARRPRLGHRTGAGRAGPSWPRCSAPVCSWEAEAAQLDVEDRAEMLDAYDLGEGALPRFIQAAYHTLGLRTFLTTGEKESRAWTYRDGSTAPECAGRIHSDLQRGFIRAETIRWDELLEVGSWAKARDVGKVRQEGKDYVVQDGDVLEIRFSV